MDIHDNGYDNTISLFGIIYYTYNPLLLLIILGLVFVGAKNKRYKKIKFWVFATLIVAFALVWPSLLLYILDYFQPETKIPPF